MISVKIAEAEAYKPYLAERLYQALTYLKTTDFSQVADGEYEIAGRDIFARINTYTTEPVSARKVESHREYIDVQYLIAGTEQIGYCQLSPALTLIEDRGEEADLLFYTNAGAENFITLQAGEAAIFFPWDAHRPSCAVSEQLEQVRKVVVKVRKIKA